MNGIRYIATSLAALVLTLTCAAQNRAYAKFDDKGEIIGLFNLADGEAACRESQTITGRIRNVRSEVRDETIAISVVLVSTDRDRVVSFSLKKDAIPLADIRRLLRSDRGHRVSIEACRLAGHWRAQEITRSGT